MATAGWQEGIAQDLHVNCTGGAEFYGRRFGCWVKGGHGAVDLEKAIYQSCDVFFYTLAEKLGIERIAKYATMLGLGQKTGIDLAQRSQRRDALGRVEDPELQTEMVCGGNHFGRHRPGRGRRSRRCNCCAPSRRSRWAGAWWCRTWSIRKDLPSGYVETSHVTETKTFRIDPNGWTFITDAMSRVLLPEGTAPSAHIPGIDIAGKTGSAQIVSLATRAKFKNSEIWPERMVRGIYAAANPDIVVCVLFEGGEHGRLAARVATQVLKAYVDKQRRLPSKMAEKTEERRQSRHGRAVDGARGRQDWKADAFL